MPIRVEYAKNKFANIYNSSEIDKKINQSGGGTGPPGPPGRTPVKGVDYFTDADIEELVGQVIAQASYIYDQITASTTWLITHNLDKYPSVTIVDTTGNVVLGDVEYISKDQLMVSFSSEFSGKAYLN